MFADRTYTDKGILTPRKEAGSMIKDPGQAVANVRRMVDEQAIYSTSGKRIPCQVDSICVHGDGPTAVTVSTAVRQGLEAAGIQHRAADRDAEFEALSLSDLRLQVAHASP